MNDQQLSRVNREVGLGEWVITLFLTSIPLVNIIMLLVWAFGENTPPCKANYAKASLLWLVISVALVSLFYGALFGVLVSNS
jgi:hypothetical protein